MQTMKPYTQYTPQERAEAIEAMYKDLKRLELSEHPRAVWSASVLRNNLIKLERIL